MFTSEISKRIERPVNRCGDDVLFEERFGPVNQWLQQAKWPDTTRSPAVLDAAYQLALQQHGVSDA
jgi:hypothetical protein